MSPVSDDPSDSEHSRSFLFSTEKMTTCLFLAELHQSELSYPAINLSHAVFSGEAKTLLCVVLVPGAVKKEVYFMAIIDILTHYDAKKKAAHAAKTVKHGVSVETS